MQVVLRVVFTFWLRYRARGFEKIPKSGGGLFLINHQSFLDPLLVGLPLSRPVSFLARDSLFRIPILGWLLRINYAISIDRESAGASSIKEALQRMKNGFLIGIFPEGTRCQDGLVGDLKPGFIAIIRRGKLPVYPVGIAGGHEALPRGAWFVRPRCVRVVFGDPLTPQELAVYTKRGQEQNLIALARARIVQCQQEAEAWTRQ